MPDYLDVSLKSALPQRIYRFSNTSGRYRFRLRCQNGNYLVHVLDNINSPSMGEGHWSTFEVFPSPEVTIRLE